MKTLDLLTVLHSYTSVWMNTECRDEPIQCNLDTYLLFLSNCSIFIVLSVFCLFVFLSSLQMETVSFHLRQMFNIFKKEGVLCSPNAELGRENNF